MCNYKRIIPSWELAVSSSDCVLRVHCVVYDHTWNKFAWCFVCKIFLTQYLYQILINLDHQPICSKTGFLMHISVSIYFNLLKDGTFLANIGSKISFNLIGPHSIHEIFVWCLNYSQQYSCKVFHVYKCLSYCDLASTEFLFITFLFFQSVRKGLHCLNRRIMSYLLQVTSGPCYLRN